MVNVNNPLGRRIEHDERSRGFAFPKKLPDIGVSVLHRMDADHVDQFYLSACVGFHGANFLNTRYARHSRAQFNVKVKRVRNQYLRYLNNNDGIANYSGATKWDDFPGEYPPDDDGSSGLGLAKYWMDLGVIKGYQWAFGFEHFLAALQKQPVGIGTWWYEGMTYPDAKGFAHPTGMRQGGHQYLASGISWGGRYTMASKRKIRFENSWGENTEFPTFFMSWEQTEFLIEDQGDVLVPIVL